MALSPGTRLGPYEIVAPAGAGGMGEVYKAIDTRLDRTVAVKVLPAHVAGNPDLKARFDREARTISNLNHPHICTLHDIGHQDGVDFLVMEYLEGETLADRIARGALPLPQALQIAIQIADALDKAHRQGVVHRDLKPGNVMLTSVGAKLLDFGLAKLRPADRVGLSAAATVSSPLTGAGTIVGTYPYMAPEQLEGRDADARSDIFAFGALVYEMVTSRRAFEGASQASVIAAILKDTPPSLSTMQPLSPPILDGIIATCLAKLPDDRWQSAGDVGRQLKLIQAAGAATAIGRTGIDMPSGLAPTPAPVTRNRSRTVLAGAAAFVVLALAAAAAVRYWPRPAPAEPVRFTIVPPSFLRGAQVAVSPDGRYIAFAAGESAQDAMLYVRALGDAEPRALAGTEGAAFPFWSPDNRHIAFAAQARLKRVALDGGTPQVITDVGQAFTGGTWNADGDILFGDGPGSPIRRVPASGGKREDVTTLSAPRGLAHTLPWFLPDGRHFLFTNITALLGEGMDVYLGSLDGAEPMRLVQGATRPMYATGYLLFDRAGELMAQPFDQDRLALGGEPSRVATNLASLSPGPLSIGTVAVSPRGVLAYVSGGAGSGGIKSRLTWRDRSGNVLGTVGEPDHYGDVALSPDGRRIAVHRHESQTGGGIWVWDLDRSSISQFTFNRSHDIAPVWSPDGATMIFTSQREGNFRVYRKPSSGAGPEEPLLASTTTPEKLASTTTPQKAESWSLKDGSVLLTAGTFPNWDVWRVTFEGGAAKAGPLLDSNENELLATVSPDGRWIAYSTLAEAPDVYVRSYPDLKGPWRVSTRGGNLPRWSANGRELFYVWNNAVWAVDVDTGSDMPRPGTPAELFKARLHTEAPGGYPYDVSRDGRFLLNEVIEPASTDSAAGATPSQVITVVVNWQPTSGR